MRLGRARSAQYRHQQYGNRDDGHRYQRCQKVSVHNHLPRFSNSAIPAIGVQRFSNYTFRTGQRFHFGRRKKRPKEKVTCRHLQTGAMSLHRGEAAQAGHCETVVKWYRNRPSGRVAHRTLLRKVTVVSATSRNSQCESRRRASAPKKWELNNIRMRIHS